MTTDAEYRQDQRYSDMGPEDFDQLRFVESMPEYDQTTFWGEVIFTNGHVEDDLTGAYDYALEVDSKRR